MSPPIKTSSNDTVESSDSLGGGAGPTESPPFLPPAIPNSINDNESGKRQEIAATTSTLASNEESSTLSMKGQEEKPKMEGRALETEFISPGSGQPQGRAFANFVTVAPTTGDGSLKSPMTFDLDDVSLDGQEEHRDTDSGEPSFNAAKTTEAVTCTHEGITFKVRDRMRELMHLCRGT